MTGRIKVLSDGGATGVIQSETGLSVAFDSIEVLAYDATCLAAGQMVTFDLQDGASLRAVNVCIHRAHPLSPGDDKRPELVRLRYMGFEQKGSVRVFRFERLSSGIPNRGFTVNGDLALFAKHHIALQEGPALCLHLLVTGLTDNGAARSPSNCTLTDQDMLTHIANRPAPRAKPHPKRFPRPSASASHA